MGDNGVMLRVTFKLDETWSSHQTREELLESIRVRLDSSLGFRGQTQKMKVLEKRAPARRKT